MLPPWPTPEPRGSSEDGRDRGCRRAHGRPRGRARGSGPSRGNGCAFLPSPFYELASPDASRSLKLLLETLTTRRANSLTLFRVTATITQGWMGRLYPPEPGSSKAQRRDR